MRRILFGVTVAVTAHAFLRDQMECLVGQGWDVHLACSPDDGTDSFHRLSELHGVTLHPLSMVRHPAPLRDLKSLLAWWRLTREIQPDIVVASTPKAGLLATLAAWLNRVPTRIYHVRGLRAESLNWPLSAVSRVGERAATAAASQVLVDSPSLLGVMHREGLLNSNKGVVLGSGSCCGVDTERFRPPSDEERSAARARFGISANQFVIGFVGRLVVDKGIRELVEAARILHHHNLDTRLLLIGSQEEEADLRESLAIVQSSEWAYAPGAMDEPVEAYWAFDAFCLPSYREGFPIATLEAQACGLPIVTTRATGCIDSISHGQTGYAVSERSVSDLTEALMTLVTDAALRDKLGIAAREWVERQFDQRLVNERVLTFLLSEGVSLPEESTVHD